MRLQFVVPLLVPLGEWASGPENPICQAWKNLLGLLDCLLYFLATGRTNGSSTGEVVPAALPTFLVSCWPEPEIDSLPPVAMCSALHGSWSWEANFRRTLPADIDSERSRRRETRWLGT